MEKAIPELIGAEAWYKLLKVFTSKKAWPAQMEYASAKLNAEKMAERAADWQNAKARKGARKINIKHFMLDNSVLDFVDFQKATRELRRPRRARERVMVRLPVFRRAG